MDATSLTIAQGDQVKMNSDIAEGFAVAMLGGTCCYMSLFVKKVFQVKYCNSSINSWLSLIQHLNETRQDCLATITPSFRLSFGSFN